MAVIKSTGQYLVKGVFVFAFVYFTILMILITMQYIPIDQDVAFLRIKIDEIALWYYQVAFFTHVYSSIFVHILGALQFSTWLRRKYSMVHNAIGKIYVLMILFFAGPSGLVMAFYATGGISSQIAFSLLAISWLFFTWKGWQFAKMKAWPSHRKFMLRSYALTLSAVSLRLIKWIIVNTLAPPPLDTYRFIAWGGWIINLLLVELYIYKKMKPGIGSTTEAGTAMF